MSHVMKKPIYATCEQQRRRLACASAQSDEHLCCSLPGLYNISSFYIRNSKPLASFCGCAGRFETYLVENPEDRFSRDVALNYLNCNKTYNKRFKWSTLRLIGPGHAKMCLMAYANNKGADPRRLISTLLFAA